MIFQEAKRKSQPKKEYPSGGNIGIVKSDDSKEKITDRRGNIKNVGVIGTAEINSYFELNNGTKIKVSEIAEDLYRMTEPKKLEGMSALEIDKMGNIRTVFAGSRVHQQKKQKIRKLIRFNFPLKIGGLNYGARQRLGDNNFIIDKIFLFFFGETQSGEAENFLRPQ